MTPAEFDRRALPETDASEELSDTDQAQFQSAMFAGWNDPVMDEYNDYDRYRDASIARAARGC